MAEMSKAKRTGSLSIEQEILIDAPRERVFKALTTEVEKWWAYRVHGEGTVVKLEPKLGGWFYEDSGKGEGAIWGTVIFFRKPEVLRLTGPLGMSGAVNSTYTYELVEKGGKTLVKLSHQAFGFVDAETKKSYAGGWTFLLAKCLKAWVEEKKTYRQVARA